MPVTYEKIDEDNLMEKRPIPKAELEERKTVLVARIVTMEAEMADIDVKLNLLK